jgi:hypothetical protein
MTFQDIAELFRSFMYDAFNKTEQDPNPVWLTRKRAPKSSVPWYRLH